MLPPRPGPPTPCISRPMPATDSANQDSPRNDGWTHKSPRVAHRRIRPATVGDGIRGQSSRDRHDAAVINAFKATHHLSDVTVVADAA